MNGQTIRTFLSANSSEGFYSYFDEFLKGKKTYVIKGGPGTGKSSFMKKIAAKAVSKGNFTEYVYCSSDPDSLDGVYIQGSETVFTDGTPPHVMEVKFPGAMGAIINVGQFIDSEKMIPVKDEILRLNSKFSAAYARAYRYLKAASCASSELRAIGQKYLDSDKMKEYFNRISERFSADKKGSGGKSYIRFLSGITPKGYVTFKDTIYTLCSDVFVIRDRYGISFSALKILKDKFIDKGFDVYEFRFPLEPEYISHIAVPELNIAFVTSDKLTHFDSENSKSVNLSRFLRDDIEFEKKYSASAAKLMKICLEEAIEALRTAKALHDDLEELYISAMDFASLDKLTEEYCNMI